MQPCSAVYRSTAHISGVMCFDSSARGVKFGRSRPREHSNDAPIVPKKQQESSFAGTPHRSIVRFHRRIVGSHLIASTAALAAAKARGKAAKYAQPCWRGSGEHAGRPQGAGDVLILKIQKSPALCEVIWKSLSVGSANSNSRVERSTVRFSVLAICAACFFFRASTF